MARIISSLKSILVDVGGIRSSVRSQYVSNHDFVEDEIKAWWSRIVKAGGKIESSSPSPPFLHFCRRAPIMPPRTITSNIKPSYLSSQFSLHHHHHSKPRSHDYNNNNPRFKSQSITLPHPHRHYLRPFLSSQSITALAATLSPLSVHAATTNNLPPSLVHRNNVQRISTSSTSGIPPYSGEARGRKKEEMIGACEGTAWSVISGLRTRMSLSYLGLLGLSKSDLLAAEQLKPVAGLDKLSKWVEDNGLKRAAVTNALRDNTEMMIKMSGLENFFQLLIIGSECE
ncbi:haloacid dehalogenase-like hydrolase domain-containing protein sgpp [Phtheirospermum japonicum]|uniref:Haloacid dehalogenase-like hydrolase domain-containing protein sgpp n=1 Tax=Phtheirospermum japonicum TaxID=374723 RepID=A0A830CFQ3_9LAMI|nr:haloacid dehalogenase-like hydrolase domain-containing protein sgpp [Phtheirospermum japonicum]